MLDFLVERIRSQVKIDDYDKKLLSEIVQIRKMKKKQILHEQGNMCNQYFFVIKGCARSYFTDPLGVDHIVNFASEGQWIGDIQSFVKEIPSEQSIAAVEDLEFISIDKTGMRRLFRKSNRFECYARAVIRDSLIEHEKRIIGNLSQTAEERYMIFRVSNPQLEQRLPLKDIASYLGVKPESLSRIRNQIEKKRHC